MRVRTRSAWEVNDTLQWCFHLAPSTPLPTVDLARSLRSKFMPQSWLPKMHAFVRRYIAIFRYSYAISALLAFSVPIIDARVGRLMSTAAIVLSTPLALHSLGSLRYEMTKLLMRTYDYWFFTCANLFTLVFCSMYFDDLRVFRAVMDWIGFQNVILADAQLRGLAHMTIATLTALAGTLLFLTLVTLDQIDDPRKVELVQLSSEQHTYNISAVDCLINGTGTMVMLLVKIGYQKTKAVRKNRLKSVIECAVYKCRLRMTPCAARFQPPLQSILCDPNASNPQLRRKRSMSLQQLQYIGHDRVFDSRKIFLPVKIVSRSQFPMILLVVIYSLGLGGLIISFMALTHVEDSPSTLSNLPSEPSWVVMAVSSYSALIATLSFSLIFGSLYQRDLLHAIVTSFDFVFFSIQVTAAHLSICVLFDWQSFHCYGVLTSWLWIHWVLTLDALTPIMKAKLRFHVRFAVPVVAVFTIGQMMLLYGIVYRESGPTDKTLLKVTLSGHHVTIRVIPFFTARLVTILLWTIRILIRLARASNDDIIILRGAVAFRNYISFASRNGAPPRSKVLKSWATKRVFQRSLKHVSRNQRKVQPIAHSTDFSSDRD